MKRVYHVVIEDHDIRRTIQDRQEIKNVTSYNSTNEILDQIIEQTKEYL